MPFQRCNLTEKVALITGASRGIGKGIAISLAEAGADIVAVARDTIALGITQTEITRLGHRCLTLPTDVTKSDQVEGMVQRALDTFGRVDILVNNAGTAIVKPLVPLPGSSPAGAERIPGFFTPTSEEEWHRVIDTNLTSAFLCLRAVGPHMLERRQGKVINISSATGIKSAVYRISYDVSKAALIMLTKALAVEWAQYNIQVNCIAPGYIKTDMTQGYFEDEKALDRLLRSIPFRRMGEPRDIGMLAVYLASEASDYVTGATMVVDGGLLA